MERGGAVTSVWVWVELVVFFGAALGIALHQLWSLEKDRRRTSRRHEGERDADRE